MRIVQCKALALPRVWGLLKGHTYWVLMMALGLGETHRVPTSLAAVSFSLI